MSFDLERIASISPTGVAALIVAAVMVYGAKGIVLGILRYPVDKANRPIIIMKSAGFFIGILGALKIMDII